MHAPAAGVNILCCPIPWAAPAEMGGAVAETPDRGGQERRAGTPLCRGRQSPLPDSAELPVTAGLAAVRAPPPLVSGQRRCRQGLVSYSLPPGCLFRTAAWKMGAHATVRTGAPGQALKLLKRRLREDGIPSRHGGTPARLLSGPRLPVTRIPDSRRAMRRVPRKPGRLRPYIAAGTRHPRRCSALPRTRSAAVHSEIRDALTAGSASPSTWHSA